MGSFLFDAFLTGLILISAVTSMRNFMQVKSVARGWFYFVALWCQFTVLIFCAHSLARDW